MKQIFIPTQKGLRMVMTENIVRVEASSSYCKVYFDNGYPLTVAKVLHWFEEKLPDDSFYRIHRTHIVNRLFISEVSRDSKLTLINGEQIQVSRRKKNAFRRMIA